MISKARFPCLCLGSSHDFLVPFVMQIRKTLLVLRVKYSNNLIVGAP